MQLPISIQLPENEHRIAVPHQTIQILKPTPCYLTAPPQLGTGKAWKNHNHTQNRASGLGFLHQGCCWQEKRGRRTGDDEATSMDLSWLVGGCGGGGFPDVIPVSVGMGVVRLRSPGQLSTDVRYRRGWRGPGTFPIYFIGFPSNQLRNERTLFCNPPKPQGLSTESFELPINLNVVFTPIAFPPAGLITRSWCLREVSGEAVWGFASFAESGWFLIQNNNFGGGTRSTELF